MNPPSHQLLADTGLADNENRNVLRRSGISLGLNLTYRLALADAISSGATGVQ